jgi:hypothetical protein
MSLLDELETRGVTAEDLEKAASVRLFEKAAAAEGVDLDLLDVEQVEDLYTAFLSNQSSDDNTKEASAMNNEIVELFEKTAADEGINLDDMADDELAELYTHYVDNVLPLQVEEYEKEASASPEVSEEDIVLGLFQKTASASGIDFDDYSESEVVDLYNHYVENVLPLQMGDKTAAAEVEEAQEKLAEAEILGRHMARAYMDELDKEASMKDKARGGYDKAKSGVQRGYSAAKEKASEAGGAMRRGASAAGSAFKAQQLREGLAEMKKAKGMSARTKRGKAKIEAARKAGKMKALRGGGKTMAAYGAGGAALYGAKKGIDAMCKEFFFEEIDEAIEMLAEERAGELLFEMGVELD